jgi:hypothetical protein
MGVIETATDLAKLVQKIGNIEVYEKVISLQSQVMELVALNMAMKEEIEPLKKTVESLRDKSEVRKALKHRGAGYYRTVEGRDDGPFCTVCWDVDERLVRMRYLEHSQIHNCDFCSKR